MIRDRTAGSIQVHSPKHGRIGLRLPPAVTLINYVFCLRSGFQEVNGTGLQNKRISVGYMMTFV